MIRSGLINKKVEKKVEKWKDNDYKLNNRENNG